MKKFKEETTTLHKRLLANTSKRLAVVNVQLTGK